MLLSEIAAHFLPLAPTALRMHLIPARKSNSERSFSTDYFVCLLSLTRFGLPRLESVILQLSFQTVQ
jgi:hypothetical protein